VAEDEGTRNKDQLNLLPMEELPITEYKLRYKYLLNKNALRRNSHLSFPPNGNVARLAEVATSEMEEKMFISRHCFVKHEHEDRMNRSKIRFFDLPCLGCLQSRPQYEFTHPTNGENLAYDGVTIVPLTSVIMQSFYA
jgi:hypothetical protein